MLLTNEQARAVVKAIGAPNCTDVEMCFNTEDGTVVATAAEDLPILVAQLLTPVGHEQYASLADFARAYGILPELPPLECPIEKALAMAEAAIAQMVRRQPGVNYNHDALWSYFKAARKEVQRLKNVR